MGWELSDGGRKYGKSNLKSGTSYGGRSRKKTFVVIVEARVWNGKYEAWSHVHKETDRFKKITYVIDGLNTHVREDQIKSLFNLKVLHTFVDQLHSVIEFMVP